MRQQARRQRRQQRLKRQQRQSRRRSLWRRMRQPPTRCVRLFKICTAAVARPDFNTTDEGKPCRVRRIWLLQGIEEPAAKPAPAEPAPAEPAAPAEDNTAKPAAAPANGAWGIALDKPVDEMTADEVAASVAAEDVTAPAVDKAASGEGPPM